MSGAMFDDDQGIDAPQEHGVQAAVTDVARAAVGQLTDQPRSATTAAATLLDPLVISQVGDAPVTIALERGSLSSTPRTLTLRARYDPDMTVAPIIAPEQTPLDGHQVTMTSTVFSVNLPYGQSGRHLPAGSATLLAQVDVGSVALGVPDLLAVSDGQTGLTFTLSAGTPPMPRRTEQHRASRPEGTAK
jgi:hypothetical protein